MFPRFVTKNIHAVLDYPVAFALITLPFILPLGLENEMAKWLSVVTGVAALMLTVFTDHATGLVRVLSYRFHLTVDLLVGIAFAAAPFVLGFERLDSWYYWLNGFAVLVVVGLNEERDWTAAGNIAVKPS